MLHGFGLFGVHGGVADTEAQRLGSLHGHWSGWCGRVGIVWPRSLSPSSSASVITSCIAERERWQMACSISLVAKLGGVLNVISREPMSCAGLQEPDSSDPALAPISPFPSCLAEGVLCLVCAVNHVSCPQYINGWERAQPVEK